MFFFSCNKKNTTKGFSLMELLMVLSIITILSFISTTGFQTYQDDVGLEKDLTEISLFFREAQINATSVRKLNGEYDGIYGVYFNAVDQRLLLYGNTEEVGLQYVEGQSEIIRTYDMAKSSYELRVGNSGDENQKVQRAIVVFKRPLLSANIFGSLESTQEAEFIEIKVTSVNKDTHNLVCVLKSGFITTPNNDSCQ